MNDNEIAILVKARDEASKTFKDVEQNAGGLGKTLGDVGKIASGFLTADVIQGGLGKLTGFLSDATAGWQEQIKVTAQTEAVLKSTGGVAGQTADSVLQLADSLKKNSLFADDAIQSGENLLLTFTNIGGDVFPDATQAMVDMSQALGQDMQSSATQLGKALNDPIKGVTALQRVGVAFTDQQKDQIKAMVEAGDVAGAQRFILAELNKEFGGSAKAASDAAGAAASYDDRMDDLQDTLGSKLLPLQLKFKEAQVAAIGLIVDKGLPAFDKLTGILAGPLGSAFSRVSGFVTNTKKTFDDFIGDLRWIFENGTGFNEKLVPGLAGVEEAIGKVYFAFKEIRKLFGDFIGDIQWIVENGTGFNEKMVPQLGALEEAIAHVVIAFGQVRDAVIPIIKDIGEQIGKFLGGNTGEIVAAIAIALAAMGSTAVISGLVALGAAIAGVTVALVIATASFLAVPLALAAIALAIIELIKHWDDITQRFPQLGQAADFVQLQIEKFTDWVQATLIPAVRNIADTVADTFRKVEGFASEHWEQITNIFMGALDIVLAIVTNVLDELVVIFKGAFEILHGVIMVFHGLFTGDWGEMWDGIKLILDGAVDVILGTFGNLKDTILGVGKVLLDGMVATFKALGSAIVEELSHLKDKAVEIVTDLGQWLIDHWQAVVTGILAVLFPPGAGLFLIITHFGEIKERVSGLMGEMKDAALDKLDDLRLGILGKGQDIINTLGDVFGRAKDWVGTQFSGLADIIRQPINAAIGYINDLIGAWNGLSFSAGGGSVLGVKIPSVSFGTPDLPYIPYLAQGTNFVPKDMLAYIHKGEAVIPAAYNKGGGDTYNIYAQSLDPRVGAELVLQTLVSLERRGGISPGVTRGLA